MELGRNAKRFISALLAFVMALSCAPVSALTAQAAQTGLCGHHTEHTPQCGYRAATPGAPCKYDGLCDKGCADSDGDGQTDHARDCAYTLTLQKDLCDQGCQDTDGDGFADHAESCAFTRAKGVHEHGETCGYQEADAGSPCAFRCEQCAALTAAPLSEELSEETTADTAIPAAAAETTVPPTTTEAAIPETTAEAAVPETTEAAVPETTEATVPEKTQAQLVQELIDALPEHVTSENAEDVKAQLTAIDDARTELTDEELDALDVTRYMAVVEALSALEGMAGANEIQTLEGTGQYQFDLQFTNIPGDITVKYTVYDENQIVLIEEQTLSVENGEGSATVHADTLPIKIKIVVNPASGGSISGTESLYAAGTWTWDFNGGIYPSLSHDHTGETPQWVKEDDTFHILTYPCGITDGGLRPHEFTDGVCQCGAEQPVYTVYALLPGTGASFHAMCHKAGADTGGLEGWSNYSNLWVFPLPASYQGEIYFQWNGKRFPEGEGILTLDAEQGAWFYDGGTGEWSLHSEENHLFLQEGEPCAVCGKKQEYSAYELYAILPDGVTNPRCFAYLNDPSSGESPVLQEPMQDMGGYWYCQLTTDQSFMTIAVASEESEVKEAYQIPGNPAPPPEGITVPDPSVRKFIYLDDDGIKDHDRYREAIASFNHYRVNGTCIVCGDSLPLAAAVEGKGYTSLEEAWEAACDAYTNKTEKAPVTITLLGDATVEQDLMLSGKELILEGGEYTVTFNDLAHSIEIYSGKLTLNSGTIENKEGQAIDMNGGSFVMNGGALKSHNDATVMMGNLSSTPRFTMTGGTIEAAGTNNDAIGVAGYRGTVTISGGSVYGQKYAVACNSNAEVTISGGSFRTDTNNTSAAGLYVDANTPRVALSGGTFDRVQCYGPTVGTLLAPDYTYYGGDGSEVTDTTGKSLSNVTVKAKATGNLDLRNATTSQSGVGYIWDADTHTLTLKNANIAGDIIFADNIGPITIQVEGDSRVGGDIKIKTDSGGDPTYAYDLTFTGSGPLYVAGHLGSDGVNGNKITIDAGADVTAAGGVSASQGGGVDGILTIKGHLTAIGNGGSAAVYIGNVNIDGGTLNVSGARGVFVGGMPWDNYNNAFVINGGTFHANCAEYNLVCATGGGAAPDIEPNQIFVIPDGYLPAGYAAQKLEGGAAIAETDPSITSAYHSGGSSLTLSADQVSGYTVTVVEPVTGGTAAASAETAKAYDKITMTATPADGWHLVSWEVKTEDGTSVPITKNTFVMPASNVTVTPFFAEKGNLETGDVSVAVASRVYNGNLHTPAVTVRYEGTTLAKGRDYTVVYTDNRNVGSATATITGVGSYQGTFDAYFAISPKPVTAVVAADKVYDGNANATVTATLDTGITGETLTVTGLTGTFQDANVGTGKTVTIDASRAAVNGGAGTDPNNYDVRYPATATANITPAPIDVTAQGYTGTYDGQSHGITVMVKSPMGTTVMYGETADDCTRDRLTYTDAGTYTVYYQVSKDNYETVTGSATVEIAPKTVNDPTIVLSPESFTYNGSEQVPMVTVKDGNIAIIHKEYEVSFVNNINAGTATVIIRDNTGGNYIVNGTKTFEILQSSLAADDVTVTLTEEPYTYDGTAKVPTVTVEKNGITVDPNEYTIRYTNTNGGDGDHTNAGTVTVTVAARENGNYIGSNSAAFTINPAALPEVTLTAESVTYNGADQQPAVTVPGLIEGTDYDVRYTRNDTDTTDFTNTGEIKITVTGKGNYTGTKEKTYTISKAAPAIAWNSTEQTLTYTGAPAVITAPTVTLVNGETFSGTITYSYEKDGAAHIGQPVDAGTYTVTATIPETDNYQSGSTSTTLIIRRATVENVQADDYTGTYDGNAHGITVSGYPSGVTVRYGTEDGTYDLTENPTYTNAGTYPVYYQLTSPNYETVTGSARVTIGRKDVAVSITAEGGVYNGSPFPASAQLEGAVENETVTVILTYTREGEAAGSVTAPTNAGNYTVTATITDSNYALTGLDSKAFTITPASIEDAKITVDGSYTYTGAAHTPAPTVTLGNETLVKDTDYTVTYANNTDAGSAEVIVTGTGNYEGEVAETFTIAPKPITVTITPNGGVYGGEIKAATAVLDENRIVQGDPTPTVTLTYIGTAYDKTEVNAKTPPTLAGAYTVTASIPEGNYVLTGETSVPFLVNRAESGLTAEPEEQKVWVYGDKGFDLKTSQAGDGALTYSSSDESVVTVDESGKVTIVGAGTAEITVTVSETDNYNGSQVKVPVTVEKKPIEITVADQVKIYGDPIENLTYEITSGTPLVEGDTLKLTLTAGEENVGIHPITAPNAAADNPNYEITVHPGSLTVKPRDITGAKVILGPMLLANGKPQTQTIERVTVANSRGEVLDVTYDVTGNTQTDAGAYTMIITGNGNFTGKVTQTFVIAPTAGQPVDTDGSGNIVLGKGKITVLVRQGAGAPALNLNTAKASLIENLIRIGSLTSKELTQVAAGSELKIVLDVTDGVSQAEQKLISDYAVKVLGSRARIGILFDVCLYKQLGNGEKTYLHETSKPITTTVRVPDRLLNTQKNVKRTFWIVRCHDGNAAFLPTRYNDTDKTLSFETDRFSGYAIVYKDTKTSGNAQNTATGDIPRTGDSSHIGLWVTVMALSAAGIGAVIIGKRKKQR